MNVDRVKHDQPDLLMAVELLSLTNTTSLQLLIALTREDPGRSKNFLTYVGNRIPNFSKS